MQMDMGRDEMLQLYVLGTSLYACCESVFFCQKCNTGLMMREYASAIQNLLAYLGVKIKMACHLNVVNISQLSEINII